MTAEVHTWLSTYTARKLFITCSGSREASHREAADERKGKEGMLISPKHTWMQTKTSHCRQILPAFFLSVSLAKLLCDFSHSFSELSQSHFPLSFSWFCTSSRTEFHRALCTCLSTAISMCCSEKLCLLSRRPCLLLTRPFSITLHPDAY